MSDSGSSYKNTKVNYHHSHWLTVTQWISDSFVKKNYRKNVKISHIKAANFALRGKCAFVSLIFFSHSFGDITIIGEEFDKVWTMLGTQWPLSSDRLLTYCDTDYGHLRWPLTFASVAEHLEWSCHYLFSKLSSAWPGIKTRSPACDPNAVLLFAVV